MKVIRPEMVLSHGGLVYEKVPSDFGGWSLEPLHPPISSQRGVTLSKEWGRPVMNSKVMVSTPSCGVISMFINSTSRPNMSCWPT